jgi:hypothetical protein
MSTQEIPSQTDFRGRAKTNDVPIARLIGFEVKDIADGVQQRKGKALIDVVAVHGRPLQTACHECHFQRNKRLQLINRNLAVLEYR